MFRWCLEGSAVSEWKCIVEDEIKVDGERRKSGVGDVLDVQNKSFCLLSGLCKPWGARGGGGAATAAAVVRRFRRTR